MRISNELRVGIMVAIGIGLLIMMVYTVAGWGQYHDTYTFMIRVPQAQGIQQGDKVLVAGVEMGHVSAVGLDPRTNEAQLTVMVKKQAQLYQGYLFQVNAGGLVGEKFIDIRPVATAQRGPLITNGSQVEGISTPELSDIFSAASVLMGQLTTTTDSLNNIIGDKKSQQDIKATLAELRGTAIQSHLLFASLNGMVQQNQSTIKQTVDESHQLMSNLNGMVQQNQGSLAETVGNLHEISTEIRQVSDTLSPQLCHTDAIKNMEIASRTVVQITNRLDHMTQTVDSLLNDKELTASVKESAHNMKEASIELDQMMAEARDSVSEFPAMAKNFEKASADLPKITQPMVQASPKIADNLIVLSTHLRCAGEQVDGIAQRVSRVGDTLGSLKVRPDISLSVQSGGESDTRSDLNADFLLSKSMLRVGVADLGNTNGLNLQLGNYVGNQAWARYGIVQSNFGVGMDYQATPNLLVTGELFDPSKLQANLILNYRLHKLGEGWWLTPAWYGVFNNGRLGLGLTYRP